MQEQLRVKERAARGRAERAGVSRSSHGDFVPAMDRLDPISLLERQAETRIAELVPIRYGRMLVSPFAFYRGAAAILWGTSARRRYASGRRRAIAPFGRAAG
jgi:hypothetical protein